VFVLSTEIIGLIRYGLAIMRWEDFVQDFQEFDWGVFSTVVLSWNSIENI
jgi:hypothetical protein